MSRKIQRARILKIPADHSMAGGRFDFARDDVHNLQRDMVIDYQELQLSELPLLKVIDGRLAEKICGVYIPHRIRFVDVEVIKCEGLFFDSSSVVSDDQARGITSALHWRNPAGDQYHLLSLRSDMPSVLLLTSQKIINEPRSGSITQISFSRDWSPVPDSPPRLIPNPKHIHQRYSGNPVSINLDGRYLHHRLFIGGVDIQENQRPDVDAVVNLGEEASKWMTDGQLHPDDRWVNKGEGRLGMQTEEIVTEAKWVAGRLQSGKRVLVHCSAGMNRSATVCCGVLILLEGLDAEAALERVRQHHPWARPDPFHWIYLRWLAQIRS